MKISALLTSAGINIGLCALFLSLYSILRKQPSNVSVYFGRRLSEERNRCTESFSLDRLVPSAGWLLKAWGRTEDEIMSVGGLDAIVFLRLLVFSIRIFSIAAAVCIFMVLPVNYFGQEMEHTKIPAETLDVFSISNVENGSSWLWVHCFALYIISLSACALLFFQYKDIARMRLAFIAASPPNPSHFSVLVRSIPRFPAEPLDVTVINFFTKYHGSSYLSHQMIYRSGTVQKILSNARRAYKKIAWLNDTGFDRRQRLNKYRCGLCGGKSHSFHLYHNAFENEAKQDELANSVSSTKKREASAAFVFFKTRYAALVASQIPQSSNPMLWAIDLAPQPHDVYWSNLWIPYKLLWIRRIGVLVATFVFLCVFLVPVTFVQGLSQLDKLEKRLPFLKGILEKKFVNQLVTGYLPSVVLMLSLYIVPPMMLLFAGIEGCISHSSKRKSACCKILYFTIWNIFFANVSSGSIIGKFLVTLDDVATLLSKAVPMQATFFITYVLTSGWTSISAELLQIFPLIWNFVMKAMFRYEDDPNAVMSFPYYTEVPKVLFFGLIGFTFSIFAPLILPFLLVYFSLGYLVYRNQIWNVYRKKYDYGGRFWPLMHNTTVFSLVLTQVTACGAFYMKTCLGLSGFVIPLVIFTLLFNETCRQKFAPIFDNLAAQDLIDMDQRDEQSGRMEEMHRQLLNLYRQHEGESSSIGVGHQPEEEPEIMEDGVSSGYQDFSSPASYLEFSSSYSRRSFKF